MFERGENKSYLNKLDTKPVFLGYKCCSKQIKEHSLDVLIMKISKKSEDLVQNYQGIYPDVEIPDGVNLNQPKRHGIKNIKDFYTARNLVACSSIWQAIGLVADKEIASLLTFTFTSLYQRVTRLLNTDFGEEVVIQPTSIFHKFLMKLMYI